MKVNYKEVYSIVESNSNIKQFFKWYISHCGSLNIPYHNLSHTLGMMGLVIDIYKKSQYKYKEYGFKLTDEDLYYLLLSALFHDYNHSGGKFSDDVNVGIAKAGLRDCLDELVGESETARILLDKCSEIINATEYPYVMDDSELNLKQRIIRECDILVCFYDDFITHNIFGLLSEMKPDDSLRNYTARYLEFIIDSLNKLKLEYSKEIIRENQNDFFDTVDKFSKLII